MLSHTQLPASPSHSQLQVPSSAQVGGEPQSIGGLAASSSAETTTCSTQPAASAATNARAARRARPTRIRRISRHASTWFVVASLLAPLAMTGAARADETHRYRFEWQRTADAESCADADGIRSRVVRQLGRDPFDDASERAIVGRVWRDDNVWRAAIELQLDGRAKGRRELSSGAASCASLDDALALAVALAIAPRDDVPPATADTPPPAGGESSIEAPSQPLAVAPAPAVADQPRAPSPAAPSPRAPASLSAGPLFLQGALPEPAFGVQAGASLGLDETFSVHLLAWHLAEQVDERREHAFSLSALGLGACAAHAASAALSLELCPAFLAGSATAVVVGPVEPVDPGAEPWLAGALLPRIRLRIFWRLGLELGGIAAVSLVRPRFELAGSRQTGPRALVLGAGLGLAVSNF